MAYRRFRSRRGATKYARASYSEVYDMHTEIGKTTLLGIHTPVTNRWQLFLSGFCEQFKRFRYKGASVSFVPVATLPADPLQVSYEAGEPTIDPRDLMNPIIHCGMRGESMGNYLDEIFHLNISDRLNALDVANVENDTILGDLERIYYTALSSPMFKKSHPQTGFRKAGLHPMVYGLTTNRPFNYAQNGTDSYPTAGIIASGKVYGTGANSEFNVISSTNSVNNIGFQSQFAPPTLVNNDPVYSSVGVVGQFFTNKLQSLGWLDTIQNYTNADKETFALLTGLPKVYMYFVMLPPAYKTEMYFRVVIRHFFEFSGFRTRIGPFSLTSNATRLEYVYDGPIDNPPVEQASMMTLSEPEVASLDVYNGEANLVSDGAM